MTRLDDRELARLASSAYEPPATARVDAVRDRLLEAAEVAPQRSPRARWPSWLTSAAAAVLACIAVAVWWSKNAPAPAPALTLATVTTSGAATFERASASAGAESVHLHDGAIRLDVVELQPTQSFAVITPDARIVVRGTSFTAVVRDEMLRRVEVVSGRVEIHRDGEPVLTLRGGETWSRDQASTVAVVEAEPMRAEPKPTPREVVAPKPAVAPNVRRAPKPAVVAPAPKTTVEPTPKREAPKPKAIAPRPAGPAPKPTPAPSTTEPKPARTEPDLESTEAKPDAPAPVVVHPAELAFQAGWRAMRAHRYAEAAQAFARADVDESGVRVEARYLYAVALMRGKDPGAVAAFESFLERHPSAARADEAALLLGRLHVLANDRDAARPWLERAARSSREAVRSRALKLLSANP